MTLADLMPNWSIVRAPSNWLLVAFTSILLIFICHLAFRDANFQQDNT